MSSPRLSPPATIVLNKRFVAAVAISVTWLASMTGAAAAPGTVVSAAAGDAPESTLAAVTRSAHAGAKGKSAATSAQACGLSFSCLASLGSGAGATRAIGIEVAPANKGRVVATLTVVDVASSNEVARRHVRGRPAAVARRVKGAVRGLVRTAATPVPTPLRVQASRTSVRADGRTTVDLTVTGGRAPAANEHPERPSLPRAVCDGAATLAATWDRPAAVIAPAGASGTLRCTVSLRGLRAQAEIALRAPAPGLYAELDAPEIRATRRRVKLSVFAIDSRGRRTSPGKLEVNASAGKATVEGDDVLLTLPRDKAPRMIVVGLASPAGIGSVLLPVSGVTRLPVDAPRAKAVAVRIAGRTFGPVKVRRGQALVPIVVPPGVDTAVVRTIKRKTEPRETIADLKVPARPRIAAVSTTKRLGTRDRARLVVAAVGPDARPAGKSTKVFALADRGEVAEPRPLGPGLFVVEYRAPQIVGADTARVRIVGDDQAANSTVGFTVVPATVSKIDVRAPTRVYVPGEEVTATARVVDAQGNPVKHGVITATLAGTPMRVISRGRYVQLVGVVPDVLPETHQLELTVSSGSITATREVSTRAGSPATAQVSSRWGNSSASVTVDVRDKFGNQVDADAFSLHASGGRVGPIRYHPDGSRATVYATGDDGFGTVEVRDGHRRLATARVLYDPPAGSYLVSAYAGGGMHTSAPGVPRLMAGMGLTRRGRQFDVSVLVGAEGASLSDEVMVNVAGRDQEMARSTTTLAVPVGVRGRYRLNRRFGLWAGVRTVLGRAEVTMAPNSASEMSATETTFGARGLAGVDTQIGPVSLQLGMSYGLLRVSEPMRDNIDGLAAVGRVEWWFGSL